MKESRVVLPICIFLCAFMCVSFIQAVQVMAKTTPPVPNRVVILPESVAVALGKRVNFTATVYDSNNKKIKGVKLDWSVDPSVLDCSISQNGVLTVAIGATPGTYSNMVKVAVHANQSIFAQAQVTILTEPFSGGVFIGHHDCTKGCSDSGELAIHAARTTFKGLALDTGGGGGSQEFTGKIDKNGNASAVVVGKGDKTFISGSITSSGGIVTGISGTWINLGKSSSGTWTVDAANVPGAGPKIGKWSIPGQKQPSGPLAVILHDDYTLSGFATHKDNGQIDGTGFSGTWTSSDNVSFTINDGGPVTGGDGTYYPAKKAASGDLLNNLSKVGTWKVSDL